MIGLDIYSSTAKPFRLCLYRVKSTFPFLRKGVFILISSERLEIDHEKDSSKFRIECGIFITDFTTAAFSTSQLKSYLCNLLKSQLETQS